MEGLTGHWKHGTLNTIYSTANQKTLPFQCYFGGLGLACSSVYNGIWEDAAFVWVPYKQDNKLLLPFLVRGHHSRQRRWVLKCFGTGFSAMRITGVKIILFLEENPKGFPVSVHPPTLGWAQLYLKRVWETSVQPSLKHLQQWKCHSFPKRCDPNLILLPCY